jgi:hypothetical protein
MARYPQNSPEIQRLIGLGEASRAHLSRDVAILRQRLDVPTRLRHSITEHPAKWLGGSLAAGTAAVLLFRRKPPQVQKKHRGLRAIVFSLAITTIRPIIKTWLNGQLKQFLASQIRPNALLHPLFNDSRFSKLP